MFKLFQKKSNANKFMVENESRIKDQLSAKGFEVLTWRVTDWEEVKHQSERIDWLAWRAYLEAKNFRCSLTISPAIQLAGYRDEGIIRLQANLYQGDPCNLRASITLGDVLHSVKGFAYVLDKGYCGRSWVPGNAYLRRNVSMPVSFSPPVELLDKELADMSSKAEEIIDFFSRMEGNTTSSAVSYNDRI